MTRDFESSPARLFNGYSEQFLVKRNIRGSLGVCSFVPARQRYFDEVCTFLNFSPNSISQLSRFSEVSDEGNVCATVGYPGSRGTDVRGAYLTRPCLLREPDTNPLRCADVTRRCNAAP